MCHGHQLPTLLLERASQGLVRTRTGHVRYLPLDGFRHVHDANREREATDGGAHRHPAREPRPGPPTLHEPRPGPSRQFRVTAEPCGRRGSARSRPERPTETDKRRTGKLPMRVLLSTYGSRGDVEPIVALAVRLQALGAEVRMCAPPDEEFRELSTREGVPLVPFDKPWRSWERPPTAEERRQRVADFIAAQYDTVAETAAGCDVIVATAMSQFVGPSVAEKLGIPYRYVLFCPDVLDGLDGQGFDELFGEPINAQRASIGLPPVGDVGEFMFTARPLLAADPTLGPWRWSGALRRHADRGMDPARRTPTPGRAAEVPGRRRTAGVRGVRQHAHRGRGHRAGGYRGDPCAGPPRTGRPRLGGPGPGRRPR